MESKNLNSQMKYNDFKRPKSTNKHQDTEEFQELEDTTPKLQLVDTD